MRVLVVMNFGADPAGTSISIKDYTDGGVETPGNIYTPADTATDLRPSTTIVSGFMLKIPPFFPCRFIPFYSSLRIDLRALQAHPSSGSTGFSNTRANVFYKLDT